MTTSIGQFGRRVLVGAPLSEIAGASKASEVATNSHDEGNLENAKRRLPLDMRSAMERICLKQKYLAHCHATYGKRERCLSNTFLESL